MKAGQSRSLSLKAWKTICLLKREGGLGMRLTVDNNSTLVLKLAWTLLTKKDSLWVKVLGGKYLRGRPFQQVGIQATDS